MSLFFKKIIPSSIPSNPDFITVLIFFLCMLGRVEFLKAQSNIDAALETSGLEWASDGLWFLQTEVSVDDEDALASHPLADEESASLALTLTGPATGAFWWRVSSEENLDFLYLVIDGEIVSKISGEVEWNQVEFDVQDGPHEILWIYEKDKDGAAGADQAWIDRLELSFNTPPSSPPTLSVARGGVRGVVISWPTANAVGYKLQASPFPNFGWSPVPNEHIHYDDATEREFFTLNDASNHLFFRLFKP